MLLHPAWGQKKMPILRSGSKQLSIKEGNFFYKDIWGVSSEARPDVFTANRFSGRQRIVFYSDRDSLAFVVKPGCTYDFVVLLNGTDSAFTRLSTQAGAQPSLTPKLVYTSRRHKGAGADTLRFRLDKNFCIHLPGKVNGSDTLDFLFDTGAGAIVVTSSLLKTKVKATLDGSTTNAGTDGSGQVQTSSGNKLEIGGLTWHNASFLAIDYKGFPSTPCWAGWRLRTRWSKLTTRSAG
jgi:predicted aspartyl protease